MRRGPQVVGQPVHFELSDDLLEKGRDWWGLAWCHGGEWNIPESQCPPWLTEKEWVTYTGSGTKRDEEGKPDNEKAYENLLKEEVRRLGKEIEAGDDPSLSLVLALDALQDALRSIKPGSLYIALNSAYQAGRCASNHQWAPSVKMANATRKGGGTKIPGMALLEELFEKLLRPAIARGENPDARKLVVLLGGRKNA